MLIAASQGFEQLWGWPWWVSFPAALVFVAAGPLILVDAGMAIKMMDRAGWPLILAVLAVTASLFESFMAFGGSKLVEAMLSKRKP